MTSDDRAQRERLLRRAVLAGDRHLHEKGDPLAALRDYSRALDHASAEELAISYEEDSFLLAALKLARIEENRNENDGT